MRFDRARRRIQQRLTAGAAGTLAELAADAGF